MTGRNEEAAERFKAVERLEKLLLRVDLLRANAIAHPQDLEARADLGAALFALGQQESGERWLLSVLDRNPRHQRARALLAGHFAETGRPELAARYREEPNASE